MSQEMHRRKLTRLRMLQLKQDFARDPCHDPDRPPRIREEPQGVWLLIRYDLADAGARPIPDGDVFWLSPDIWISGGDALGNAIAGKATGVHARVWNVGNFASVPTRVDFSFVDPSIGIPWHAPQLIGTAWASIPALAAVEVTCPSQWIPAETGSTHACLLVTCSHSFLDPATAPGRPREDRHAGQRNVTIVQQPAGRRFDFHLMFAPTARKLSRIQLFAGAVLLDARNTTHVQTDQALRRTLDAVEFAGDRMARRLMTRRAGLLRRQWTGRDQALGADHLGQHLQFRIGEGAASRTVSSLDELADVDLTAPDQPELIRLGGDFRPSDLQPRRIDLSFTPPEHRGDIQLHLWQVEDGAVSGGYTVLFKGTNVPGNGDNQKDGDSMTKGDDTLERAVIRSHPAAQAAYEISRQLSNFMPFESREAMLKKLGGNKLRVCGAEVSARQIERVLPPEVFPIRTQADLVEKVSSAIRVGTELLRQTCITPRDDKLSRLAATLAGDRSNTTPTTAAGYFTGPSLFGAGRKEETC